MANRLRVKKISRVSLVHAGDDPEAQIVLAKADKCDHKNSKKGDSKCPDCGAKNVPVDVGKEGVPGKDDDGDTLDTVSTTLKKIGRKLSGPRRSKLEGIRDEIDSILSEDEGDPVGKATKTEKFDLPDDLPEEVVNYVKALEDTVMDLEDDLDAIVNGGGDDEDEDTEKSADDIVKAAPPEIQALVKAQQEELAKARAEASEAAAIAKAERDARLEKEYIAKGAALPHITGKAEDIGGLLRKVAEHDPETAEAIEALLTAANAAIEQGDLFKQASDPKRVTTGTAYEKMVEKADELIKADPNLTPAAAIAKVAETDSALYAEYLAEKKER